MKTTAITLANPCAQRALTNNLQQNPQGPQMRKPLQHDTTAFGNFGGIQTISGEDYIKKSSDVIVKGDMVAKDEFVVGKNVQWSGNIEAPEVFIASGFKGADCSIKSDGMLLIGNNSHVKQVESNELNSWNNVKIEVATIRTTAIVGKNADIGTIEAGRFSAEDGLKAKEITVHRGINLSSIKELESISILPYKGDTEVKEMILNSLDIAPKKIRLILGNIKGLTIHTPDGSRSILERFHILEQDGVTKIAPEVIEACVKVAKIAHV